MPSLIADHALTALVYTDSAQAEATLAALADYLHAHDLTLAGLIQRALDRPASARCDMALEDLATGARTSIADDRGPGAAGCALDVDALLGALMRAQAALDTPTDLLLVNKFGKMEAEGGGFRPLIVAALERGIPAIVAVPARNLAAWELFADDISVSLPLETLPTEPKALLDCLGLRLQAPKELVC